MEITTKIEFIEQSKVIVSNAKVEITDETDQSALALTIAKKLWEEAHAYAQAQTINTKR